MPDEVIDKGSAIPRVSWAVFLSIMAFVVAGSRFQTRMSDVADRQDKYIERRDNQHQGQQAEIARLREELMDAEDRIDAMCQELAVHLDAVICG